MEKLELYNDSDLKSKVMQSDEEGFILDFGDAKIGEVLEFEYWIYNPDTKVHRTDMKFTINHPEIKILQAPTYLEPKQKEKIRIEWTPTLQIEDSLFAKLIIEGINKWKKREIV